MLSRRRQAGPRRWWLNQPCSQQPPQAGTEQGDKARTSGKKGTETAAPRDPPASTSYEASYQQGDQQALTGLKPFHVAAFAAILTSGLAFLAVLLYITADMQFQAGLP